MSMPYFLLHDFMNYRGPVRVRFWHTTWRPMKITTNDVTCVEIPTVMWGPSRIATWKGLKFTEELCITLPAAAMSLKLQTGLKLCSLSPNHVLNLVLNYTPLYTFTISDHTFYITTLFIVYNPFIFIIFTEVYNNKLNQDDYQWQSLPDKKVLTENLSSKLNISYEK